MGWARLGTQALLPDLLSLAAIKKCALVSAQPLAPRRVTTGVYRSVYLQIY